MKHKHICLCGASWSCILNILPIHGIGRIRCERWPDSICDGCINGCLAGRDLAEQKAILASMVEAGEVGDALLAWRAKQKLTALKERD